MAERRRTRNRGVFDDRLEFIVLDGQVRLTDLALRCGWSLLRTSERLAQHGVTPRQEPHLPGHGRWVGRDAAKQMIDLANQNKRKKGEHR